jgi:hypothetical protein
MRLSGAQRDYLLQATYLPARLRELVAKASFDRDACELEVSSEIADDFQSAFTERLANVGFDADYNLTDEGTTLEDLIDVFDGEV